jgi:hypothetical protein
VRNANAFRARRLRKKIFDFLHTSDKRELGSGEHFLERPPA